MSQVNEAVWADILGYVRTHHPAIARGWFGQLVPSDLNGGQLTVVAANGPQLCYLEEHCGRLFGEAAQAATGRLVSVRFEAATGEKTLPSAAGTEQPPGYGSPSSVLRLNGDYRFEHFVVGPCNQMAHASCVALSDSPGTVYNPLFIHGSAGLGKTHLLQAICHHVLDHSPATRIAYLSCEMFVNDFIEAVQNGALNSFRYRYRHADMLMIDDIQFLARGDRTQEEFFHTFNTLYQSHKQIVVSADCSPSEIPDLEDRLVSRFRWGLVVRIDPPCLETRVAILRKKMKMRGIEIPEDVAMHLAGTIKSNTRELEGALNRLTSMAKLESRPIDMELSRQVLGEEYLAPRRNIRIQDIMNLVTERFDVRLADLQGRRRSRSIALPRQVCMFLARQFTSHSLGEIGGFFGGRDHTTVLHATKLIASRVAKEEVFRKRIEEIEAALQRG